MKREEDDEERKKTNLRAWYSLDVVFQAPDSNTDFFVHGSS